MQWRRLQLHKVSSGLWELDILKWGQPTLPGFVGVAAEDLDDSCVHNFSPFSFPLLVNFLALISGLILRAKVLQPRTGS